MKFKTAKLSDYLKIKEIKIIEGKKVFCEKDGNLVIGCAYCKKTGIDHDGLSVCPVCRGKKENTLEEPVVMCAFCKGRGSSNSLTIVCRVCDGKGLVHVDGPIEKCPECHGRGKMTGTDLMCIKCMGKGIITNNKRHMAFEK